MLLTNGEYAKYLKSPEWKAFRQVWFGAKGKYCRVCFTTDKVHLHHLQYVNYRSKRLGDYVALCANHHNDLTKKWRRSGYKTDLRMFTELYIRSRGKRI